VRWLLLLALVLEVAGLGLAIYGVERTGSDLFPGRRSPRQRATDWLRRLVGRPRPRVVVLGTAGTMARGVAMDARAE
jgi:hypothetical protein